MAQSGKGIKQDLINFEEKNYILTKSVASYQSFIWQFDNTQMSLNFSSIEFWVKKIIIKILKYIKVLLPVLS